MSFGTLIAVVSTSEPSPRFVFLGPVATYPRTVVFCLAYHVQSEDTETTTCFSALAPNSVLPHFKTSLSIFRDMLCAETDIIKIAQVAYYCTRADFHKLQVHARSPGEFVALDKFCVPSKKSDLKMPFGFKLQRRARAPKTSTGADKASSSHRTSSHQDKQPIKAAAKELVESAQQMNRSRHAVVPSVYDITSGSDTGSSSTSSDDANDDFTDNTELPPDRATENKAVNKSIRRAAYFSKEIGFSEIGIQTRYKAKCYYCQLLGKSELDLLIPKDSVRIAFHHDERSPSRWLHASCASPMMQHTLASMPALRQVFYNQLALLQSSVSRSDQATLLHMLMDELQPEVPGTGSASSSSRART